jgi:hypothetical protein
VRRVARHDPFLPEETAGNRLARCFYNSGAGRIGSSYRKISVERTTRESLSCKKWAKSAVRSAVVGSHRADLDGAEQAATNSAIGR